MSKIIDEKNQMKYDPHGKDIEFVHSSRLYKKINMFPNSNKLFILKMIMIRIMMGVIILKCIVIRKHMNII